MIREATQDDLGFLIETTLEFNKRHYDVPISLCKAHSHLRVVIDDPLTVVLRSDTGFIIGVTVEDPLRHWSCMLELGWYDTGRSGIKLLNRFEDIAREVGVNEIRMTTLAVNDVVSAILRRKGYVAMETSHRLLI
jgi:hypothetical protein